MAGMLLVAACAPTGSSPAASAPPAPPTLPILATLHVTPEPVAVSQPLQVEIRVDGVRDVVLTLAPGGIEVPLRPTDTGVAGTVTLVAPAEPGDFSLEVTGTSELGPVRGARLGTVGAGPACSAGEVPEAGGCVPEVRGSPLQIERMAVVNVAPPDQHVYPPPRLMIHPRASIRLGDVLVGCHSDSIGLLALEDMDRLEGAIGPDADPAAFRAGLSGEDTSPVVESMLAEGGLGGCENMVLDRERGFALIAARGSGGLGGGVGVWRLPDLSARPLLPATHVATEPDAAGVDGLALRGDLLYALGKPDRLRVLRVGDAGLTAVAEVLVPGMLAGWHLAVDGARLLATDTGIGEPGAVAAGLPATPGGRLFVFDLTDPLSPHLVGSVASGGTAKSLAVLPDGVVAVASGSEGVELFDVAAVPPVRLRRIPTRQAAIALTYEAGYLLVADWDALLLFDATDRGALHLLGSTDMGAVFEAGAAAQEASGDAEVIVSTANGIFSTAHVSLEGGRWVLSEFDAVYTGRILPGRRGPSLTLHDRRRVFGAASVTAGEDLALRLSNNGREGLRIGAPDGPGITGASAVLVPPATMATLEVRVASLDGARLPPAVSLESNDPMVPLRRFQIGLAGGQYRVGDPMPPFRMPLVNGCPTGSCAHPPDPCFDASLPEYAGRVIVLAFFSSW